MTVRVADQAAVRHVGRQRAVDDKYIYVTLDFDSVEEAAAFKGFLETTVWTSAEASPALDGTPTARVLTDVSAVP